MDTGLADLVRFLRKHKIRQSEVADWLGVSAPLVCLKFKGKRPISEAEIREIKRYAALRLRTRPSHLLITGRVA